MLCLQVRTTYAGVESLTHMELGNTDEYERSTYIIRHTRAGWVVEFLFNSGEVRNPLGLATLSMELNGEAVKKGISRLAVGSVIMTRVDLGGRISLYTREVKVTRIT